MDQRYRAAYMARGRSCSVRSFRIRHVGLGCSHAARSGQPGQLVALPCRCSLLPRLSHDLASAERALFNAAFDSDGAPLHLVRHRPLDRWHDLGGSALSVASRRNQRMATPHGSEPRIRHRSRQRADSVPAPSLHLSHSGLPCRPGNRLSRQRGALPRGLCRSCREHRFKIGLGCIDGDCLAHRSRTGLAPQPGLQNKRVANRSSRCVTRFLNSCRRSPPGRFTIGSSQRVADRVSTNWRRGRSGLHRGAHWLQAVGNA